ncbi:peptidylprolyl isomerase fpr3 [Pleurotus ostreatus]|nr:peptidylprolyl isomerase fpr3 [Pleurotus ostreatus]
MLTSRFTLFSQLGKLMCTGVSPISFKFTVGRPDVIKGLSLGVLGMCPNGERHLTIPAHLAFGKQGLAEKTLRYSAYSAGAVPPDSTVNTKVKMHKVYLPDYLY